MSRFAQPGMPAPPSISVAMAGLDVAAVGLGAAPPGGERVRAMIAWLAQVGARGVRVDATLSGIRPRELDRSGRRDLGALLRRSELAFDGIDLFVPPEHFTKPDMTDRAVSAALGAIDLASDLAQLAAGAVVTRLTSGTPTSVSLVLPRQMSPDIRATIADQAVSRGVRIADHAWPLSKTAGEETGPIGAGIDPATALGSGADPIMAAAGAGVRLVCARLSDLAAGPAMAGSRVTPGTGRLDVGAYLATLATIGYQGSVVLDLAGLKDPRAAVQAVA